MSTQDIFYGYLSDTRPGKLDYWRLSSFLSIDVYLP